MRAEQQPRGGWVLGGEGKGTDAVRIARAALSRLFEPLDPVGILLVEAFGPEEALRIASGRASAEDVAALRTALEGSARPDRGGPSGAGPAAARVGALASALERWAPRVPHLAPERDLEAMARLGGRLVVPEDAEWPAGLLGLGAEGPLCLWVRGDEPLPAAERSVAIVGSRDATGYGISVAGELARGVADLGLTVVSGGAYGIDGQAHRAALSSSAAAVPTVAVMAGGVDRYYPSGNEELLREVARRGHLVSELPPGASPSKHRFLKRNRLIAAMSALTVVVEARWRSGALSTARRAVDLGRHVAAVPGSVYSANSAGCHRLLRDGAACVTDAKEAYELVAPSGEGLVDDPGSPVRAHDGLSLVDLMVLEALPVRRGAEVESLAVVAGLSEAEIRAGLGRLSLVGLCERSEGGWRRSRQA
ncbi:DNA processing protein [Sinomonas atrocyanea]|uniref:DNA-processing protein DprA n=1 Tax=Sinomonas atrocyanea TaxID=37927 RepID=UPI00277F2A7C|nr:DNA-processing protein DprA [Sinomonas atrocyanea]MDP9883791.1 DNA processing protein [Sinomonas atrocyanea]